MPQADGYRSSRGTEAAPTPVFSWDVITHVHKERTADWYWALGLIAVVAAGISMWLGNLLFAIIILVSAGSLGMLAARGPREHSVHVSERGISIDGTVYAYTSLKSFWVDNHPEQPRLYLMTYGVMAPHITLPLDDQTQGEQVRSYLVSRVEEVEQEPHFGEHILELIGL